LIQVQLVRVQDVTFPKANDAFWHAAQSPQIRTYYARRR